jgi:hypothetical protein
MAESTIQTREQRMEAFLSEEGHRLFAEEVSSGYFLEYPQFDGRVAVPVASEAFTQYSGHWFRTKHKRRLDDRELKHLAADVADRCRFEVPPEPRRFFLRAGRHNDTLYLDLADSRRRVVAIDASGWRLTADCPVSFQRTSGMSSLPVPEAGGRLDDLWALLPPTLTQTQRWLLLGWLLAAFDPTVEHPLLVLCGPAESGKSSIVSVLQGLIDPSLAGLGGGLSSTDRDLRVAMSNSWVFVTDNLSKLTLPQSDTFCQRVTGGSLRSRALFTDAGEIIRPIEGPSVLSCLTNVVEQADLLTRSFVLELPELPARDRRDKSEVFADFGRLRPKLLGVLLDLLSAGVSVPPRPELAATSRVGAAVKLVERCFEGGGLPPGAFAKAVTTARNAVIAQPLDSWPVTPYLLARFAKEERIGAAAMLFQLTELAKEDGLHRHADWPKTPSVLARQLRQNTPALKTQGLIVKPPTSNSGKEGKKYHLIPFDADEADTTEIASEPARSGAATAPEATAA